MSLAFGSAVRLTSCLSITMDVERDASKSRAASTEARPLRVSIFEVLIAEKEDRGCEEKKSTGSLIHMESPTEAFTHSLAATASFKKDLR
jgi:hypothetical protein